MQILSTSMEAAVGGSSMIRKMFEQGLELKRRFGAENVYDFSLGNPDLPSPEGTRAALEAIAATAEEPLAFGYCPNAGIPEVRARIAAVASREQETTVDAANILMTVGAAGGITSFFRAVLNPGDEVVCPSPYFVEYGAYCGHFGGKLVPVPMPAPDFRLDVAALEAAITDRTRVVLVNNPNNPTGAVYGRDEIAALGAMLERVNAGRERPVFLLSDEPYRALCYDGATVPPILPASPFAIVVGSYSKTLSLPGERVGYLLVNPAMPDAGKLIAGLTVTIRSLGFVNAPVVGQRLAAALCEKAVDTSVYQRRRDAMAEALSAAGIRFAMPRGAFYIFAEVPGGDDRAFVEHLVTENILAVPGSGFGRPGYMRLAFCVNEKNIRDSAPAFRRAMESWGR